MKNCVYIWTLCSDNVFLIRSQFLMAKRKMFPSLGREGHTRTRQSANKKCFITVLLNLAPDQPRCFGIQPRDETTSGRVVTAGGIDPEAVFIPPL